MLSTAQSISTTDASLTVASLLGEPVSLRAQGKTTVFYFFAPWCSICHASISNLQTLYQNNKHIDVIAIALDYSDKQEISAFTKQHQLTFPVALGNEAVKKHFLISGYPSYYVIDKDNVIIAKSMGYSSQLGLFLRTL